MIAHANAAHNPHAMFRRELSRKAYERAELIADPLNRMDEAPGRMARRQWCSPALRRRRVRCAGGAV